MQYNYIDYLMSNCCIQIVHELFGVVHMQRTECVYTECVSTRCE